VLRATSGGYSAVLCNLFGSGVHDTAKLGQPFNADFELMVDGASTSAVHVSGFSRGELGPVEIETAETRPAPACLEALGPIWRNAPSMYIGCGARSPLHFDCLENVLCLVRGRKRIALWHPAHTPLLYAGGGGSSLFSQVDDVLSAEAHAAFPLLAEASALALHVELRAGDALYLPCGWWHDVRTPSGERSLSLSFWAQQPESKLLAASDEVVDPGEHEGAEREAESRFAIR
jgi:hypothetical protein